MWNVARPNECGGVGDTKVFRGRELWGKFPDWVRGITCMMGLRTSIWGLRIDDEDSYNFQILYYNIFPYSRLVVSTYQIVLDGS